MKHGNYALLTPDGLVKNIIPGFENCDVTILSTPSWVLFRRYLVCYIQMAATSRALAARVNFLYVITGNVEAKAEGKTLSLTRGGYLYCPPGEMMLATLKRKTASYFYINAAILLSGHARGWFPATPTNWSVFIMKAWKMLFCWIFLPKSWASI